MRPPHTQGIHVLGGDGDGLPDGWEMFYGLDMRARNQGWLSFWGHWGELKKEKSESGPRGPVFRFSANITGDKPFAYMWTDPIFWGTHPTYPAIL